MAKINPIENFEQAELDFGGEELLTHLEHEDDVIHNVDQLSKLPAVGQSACDKLTHIISGYYHSPEGVFPLDEFMYWITDKEVIIYDRMACRVIAVGISAFTLEEITWIVNNLPLYNAGVDVTSGKHYLDFRELRNEGWMVFRRSGSDVQLIGFIRHHLKHFLKCKNPKIPYHFEDRDDNVIISDEERKIINDFIIDQMPKIPVTRITTETRSFNITKGEIIDIPIQIYPENASDKSFYLDIPSYNDVFSYEIEDNIIHIKAIGEGIISFDIVSSNPEEKCEIRIESLEYTKLVNDNYVIYRGDKDIYPDISDYIELTGQITSVEVFKNTFSNSYQNVHIYDEIHVEVNDGTRFVGTGMFVELFANNKMLESIRVVYKGDVSGDGQIGGFDVTLIENYIAGIHNLEDVHFIAADVDYNGVVDERDVAILKKMIQDATVTGALIQSDKYFIVERLLGKYITNIDQGTTIKQFKNNITNDNALINIYNRDGYAVTVEDQMVSTGMKVKFESKGHVYDEAYIVIIGDVDGNGAINLNDLSTIISNNNRTKVLNFPYTIAGDLNFTGKVDGIDETYMRRYLEGDIKNFNNLIFPDTLTIKENKDIKYIEYNDPNNLPTISSLYESLYNVDSVVFVYDQTNNIVTDMTQNVFTGLHFKLEDQYNHLTFDEVYVVVKGDVNGDGCCDIGDLYLIENTVAGNQTLTDIQTLAGDVDGDGYVTKKDDWYVEQCIAYVISDFNHLPELSLYNSLVNFADTIGLSDMVINKRKHLMYASSSSQNVTVRDLWTNIDSQFIRHCKLYDVNNEAIYYVGIVTSPKYDSYRASGMSNAEINNMLLNQELTIWNLVFDLGDESWEIK